MEFLDKLKEKFSSVIVESLLTPLASLQGDPLIVIKKEAIREICEFVKNDPDYDMQMLMDLSCIDYLFYEGKNTRFQVLYNLYSLNSKKRLLIKAEVTDADPTIDSITYLWPAANWYEREVWDMFGVSFNGHPNLKRILMYEGFDGHALRKDYHFNRRQPIIGPEN